MQSFRAKSTSQSQAVVRQSSCSPQAVLRKSSGSLQAVLRQSLGSCQAVVRQSSGSCQAVVNHSIGSHQASDSCQIYHQNGQVLLIFNRLRNQGHLIFFQYFYVLLPIFLKKKGFWKNFTFEKIPNFSEKIPLWRPRIELEIYSKVSGRANFLLKSKILLNPILHDLWKKEKCPSLAPSRGNFVTFW